VSRTTSTPRCPDVGQAVPAGQCVDQRVVRQLLRRVLARRFIRVLGCIRASTSGSYRKVDQPTGSSGNSATSRSTASTPVPRRPRSRRVWTCSRTARPSVSIRKARAHLTGDCTSSTPAWRDCAALRCARIPVGLIGTGQVLIAGDRCWHRSPGAVHFGPALGFSGRVGDERSAPIRREITETVRAAVQRLSGQDYVDRYAASVKAGGPIARLGPARWTVTTTGP